MSSPRFITHYLLTGSESDARAKAKDICLEQTVEYPEAFIPEGFIREEVVGRIESFEKAPDGRFRAMISYSMDTAGGELPQLLNVLFGNISMKPGIQLKRFELPRELADLFRGPRFGIEGLRNLLDAPDRPLLCTAIKPMGLSAKELAALAFQCALGGVDVIKDDHGISDQPYAPFKERVKLCAEAVRNANAKSGFHSIYAPNITGPADQIFTRALYAREMGAGGFLISPGLAGFDALRQVANDNAIDLPVFLHPAFLGSHVISPENGISYPALFGQIARLAGADGSIFPNYGGRFSFPKEECVGIADACRRPMNHFKPIFPVPGGGMSLERVPEMLSVYGKDLMFLVGGALLGDMKNLADTCRRFRELAAVQS